MWKYAVYIKYKIFLAKNYFIFVYIHIYMAPLAKYAVPDARIELKQRRIPHNLYRYIISIF